MSNSKKMTEDLIFWFLVICAITFGVSQFAQMLSSTQGVSTSAYLFAWVAVSLNFYLAYKAHKANPSRLTIQATVVQFIGVIIYTSFISLVIYKGNNVWDMKDSITSVLVAFGIFATLSVSTKQNLPWADPVVKGYLSLFFRAVPLFIMAYKVFTVGGAGLSVIMIVTFHILAIVRITQIAMSITEAGWDRNRRGLIISEIGNEMSWVCVTVSWLITR